MDRFNSKRFAANVSNPRDFEEDEGEDELWADTAEDQDDVEIETMSVFRGIGENRYPNLESCSKTRRGIKRRAPGLRPKTYRLKHSTLSVRRSPIVSNLATIDSTAQTVLTSLRAFDEKLRANPTTPGWLVGSNDLSLISNLCSKVMTIFSRESRAVGVPFPCYVFGDIHGNFDDLMSYQDKFWKNDPENSSTYLFLGDYVDRGSHGVECICNLFALKVVAPLKFFLIRGNHEVRSIQKSYGFHQECIDKYGHQAGTKIWEDINKAFDCLPIAAIIDNSIYCAHGGIPACVTRVDDIQRIPCPLPNPEKESQISWEILWNDPDEEGRPPATLISAHHHAPRGFRFNNMRGTGFYFSEQAVDAFLQANHLSLVIRAHEMIPRGFRHHFNGKVITVFSSSRYCGGNNKAACILVEDNDCTIIKLET